MIDDDSAVKRGRRDELMSLMFHIIPLCFLNLKRTLDKLEIAVTMFAQIILDLDLLLLFNSHFLCPFTSFENDH